MDNQIRDVVGEVNRTDTPALRLKALKICDTSFENFPLVRAMFLKVYF
jgi:hypothetical protein